MIDSLNAASAAQGFLIASKQWERARLLRRRVDAEADVLADDGESGSCQDDQRRAHPQRRRPDPSGDGHMAIIDRRHGL